MTCFCGAPIIYSGRGRPSKYCSPTCKATKAAERYRAHQLVAPRKTSRRHLMEPIQRFMQQVEVQLDGCWHWTGNIHRFGYGRFYVPGSGNEIRQAHRWHFEHQNGVLAADVDVDHMCHNEAKWCRGLGYACLHRRCVNLDHLVAATRSENISRAREVVHV